MRRQTNHKRNSKSLSAALEQKDKNGSRKIPIGATRLHFPLETDAEPHNTERFEPSAGEVMGEGGLVFAPRRAT